MSFNEQDQVNSKEVQVLTQIEDFPWLGSWLDTTKKDVKMRLVKA